MVFTFSILVRRAVLKGFLLMLAQAQSLSICFWCFTIIIPDYRFLVFQEFQCCEHFIFQRFKSLWSFCLNLTPAHLDQVCSADLKADCLDLPDFLSCRAVSISSSTTGACWDGSPRKDCHVVCCLLSSPFWWSPTASPSARLPASMSGI